LQENKISGDFIAITLHKIKDKRRQRVTKKKTFTTTTAVTMMIAITMIIILGSCGHKHFNETKIQFS